MSVNTTGDSIVEFHIREYQLYKRENDKWTTINELSFTNIHMDETQNHIKKQARYWKIYIIQSI